MESRQAELELPFPELGADQPLIPLRMLNEHVYCPRLAYLEWVQGEWADSADTVDGRHKHRRVDKPSGQLPDADAAEQEQEIHARSVTLSSNRLGLIGKLDLIEGEGNVVTPVDYKRGKRPHVAAGAYDPERVQLCAQGLLLREHGYQCEDGAIYYVAGRERVRVAFDEELLSLTRRAITELRATALGGHIPRPLVDSPKCAGCSLAPICLPDEMRYLQHGEGAPRPIAVPYHEALPLYIQHHSAKLSKSGDVLEVSDRDGRKLASARLRDVSQVVLQGNVYVTTPCLQALMQLDVPVSWNSYGGFFFGHSIGNGHKNVELRTAQYRSSFDERICLRVARGLVAAKITNCRTQLRRNWKGEAPPERLLADLKQVRRRAERADSTDTLLGHEGHAAALYFGAFRQTLKAIEPASESLLDFDFARRNRRPPTDPVNAMLSFAYSMLVRTWTTTLTAVGFDAFRGFYHQPRYGRPALALDLMEPFRPLLADSVVMQVINNGEVRPSDFLRVAGSVNLDADGRKRFIAAFERRLSHEITHPLFGYRLSYRRLLELQARLFGRFLLGELPDYPNFTTR